MKKVKNRFIHIFTLLIIKVYFLDYNGATVFGKLRSTYSKWAAYRKIKTLPVPEQEVTKAFILLVLAFIVDIFIVRDIYIILKELSRDYKS